MLELRRSLAGGRLPLLELPRPLAGGCFCAQTAPVARQRPSLGTRAVPAAGSDSLLLFLSIHGVLSMEPSPLRRFLPVGVCFHAIGFPSASQPRDSLPPLPPCLSPRCAGPPGFHLTATLLSLSSQLENTAEFATFPCMYIYIYISILIAICAVKCHPPALYVRHGTSIENVHGDAPACSHFCSTK